MRICSPPKPSCVIEMTPEDAELLCERNEGLMLRDDDEYYILIQGNWIKVITNIPTN